MWTGVARWTSWTTRATGSTIRAGTVMVGSRRPVTTNLYNRVQPLLRLEVTDLVTLDPDPCRCGRTLVRGSAIHGRSEDILFLPAHDGGRVAVHPLHFALLTRDPQVRVVQVVQDGPMLRVLVVPSHAAAAGDDPLESRLDQAVTQQLLKLGVHDPQVTVERRPKLPRAAGGKLKLVIADPASQPIHTHAR
jgi:phenylacetate-CoA ligase